MNLKTFVSWHPLPSTWPERLSLFELDELPGTITGLHSFTHPSIHSFHGPDHLLCARPSWIYSKSDTVWGGGLLVRGWSQTSDHTGVTRTLKVLVTNDRPRPVSVRERAQSQTGWPYRRAAAVRTQQFVLRLPVLALRGLVTRRYMVPGRRLGLRVQAQVPQPSLLCGSEQAQLPLCAVSSPGLRL